MTEFQNLDLTFTGLGRTPTTRLLSGSGGDEALPRFLEGLSLTERCFLTVLCDQIAAEIRRQDKETP